jgi:hypothetical protein
MFGFKFVITSFFPHSPPLVFLDEPENPNLVLYIDYIEKGNLLTFAFLDEWK